MTDDFKPLHCAHVKHYYYFLQRSVPEISEEAGVDETIEWAHERLRLSDKWQY